MTKKRVLRPRGMAREEIVKAATHLFADRGYADVTLREIAQKAKVHLPAIYKAFKNKRALYVQCCTQVFSNATHEIAQEISLAESDREKVFVCVRELSRIQIYKPLLTKLVYRCVLDEDKDILVDIMDTASQAYHKEVIRALDNLIGKSRAFGMFFALSSLVSGAYQARDFRLGGDGEPDPNNLNELTIFSLEYLLPGLGWREFEI